MSHVAVTRGNRVSISPPSAEPIPCRFLESLPAMEGKIDTRYHPLNHRLIAIIPRYAIAQLTSCPKNYGYVKVTIAGRRRCCRNLRGNKKDTSTKVLTASSSCGPSSCRIIGNLSLLTVTLFCKTILNSTYNLQIYAA